MVLDHLRAQLANGEEFHGEVINYRKDGSEFVLAWTISPIRDESGKVLSDFRSYSIGSSLGTAEMRVVRDYIYRGDLLAASAPAKVALALERMGLKFR